MRSTTLAMSALFATLFALTSSPALAAGGGDHGDSPEYGLLTVDVGTAIWTILVFVGLLIILRLAAWKPIQEVLTRRENFIAESLSGAKAEREQAAALLADYQAQLEKAKDDATAIVEEGRRDAEAVRRKIEEQAREESEKMVSRAKRELELATDNAVKELYDLSAALGTNIASRIIRKELDPKEHERLIDESIEEMRNSIQRN